MPRSRPKVKVRVYRYSPEVDEKPHYEIYEVPLEPGMKVLDALIYIQENIDPTLAFRYGCKSWRCGACSIMINGKPGAACKTKLDGEEVTLEPLPGLPVIRDLVVDHRPLRQKLYATALPYFSALSRPSEPMKIPKNTLGDYMVVTQCIECWSCIAACPVVSVAPGMQAGPALLVALAQSVYNPANRIDKLAEAISSGLYNCTTCRACWEACPAELEIPDLVIEKMRAKAVSRGLGPLQRHLKFTHLIESTGKSIEKTTKPFLESIEKEVFTVENPRDRVAFFTGCLADYRLQNVAQAVVKLLQAYNVEVVVPKGQVCCGSVLVRTGQLAPLKKLVEKNISVFKDAADKVVTACAGCSLTLKRNWPQLVKEHLCQEMPFKVHHLSEYLINVLKIDDGKFKEMRMKVTWHDPCHLRRGQGIYREPRRLLKMIPGLQLVEMRRPDFCCGAGGGVRAGLPELTWRIRVERVKDAKDTRAEAIVTECPFCLIQLRDAVKDAKLDIDVVYLEELLAKALR